MKLDKKKFNAKQKGIKRLYLEFPTSEILQDFMCYDIKQKSYEKRRFEILDGIITDDIIDDIIYTLNIWKLENPMDNFTTCLINTSDKDYNSYYCCKNNSLHLIRSYFNNDTKKHKCCINTIYFYGEEIKIKKTPN